MVPYPSMSTASYTLATNEVCVRHVSYVKYDTLSRNDSSMSLAATSKLEPVAVVTGGGGERRNAAATNKSVL